MCVCIEGIVGAYHHVSCQDFWLTVLYKRIVRGPVFNATASRQDVRVYAACANADK